MKAIIAKNNLSFIGGEGKLLWECKDDLHYFKKMTANSRCLVGYNTHIGLPPLKNRELIVDARGESLITNVDWCIGGKKTYEKYCHLFTELHISIIDDNSIGDCVFPNLENLNKNCKIIINHFKK